MLSPKRQTAGPLRVRPAVGSMLVGSERNLAAQLPISGDTGGGCFAEVSIQQVGINIRQVCPVEEIEDFKPELEVDPFGNTGLLINVDVRLGKIRPAELACLLVALRTESGRGELSRSEAPVEKRAARISLVIAACVRVVEPECH